jgi:hypothetical protein
LLAIPFKIYNLSYTKGLSGMRYSGVISRGITAPIFRQGDDLAGIVCRSVLQASRDEGFEIQDGDIIGVAETVVARTQGNYANTEQIAKDVREKLGGKDMGILFPILSRNRFGVLLRAFSKACDRLYIQLSYPADELGNELIDRSELDEKGIDPYSDSFDERGFRAIFKDRTLHRFTGVDYVKYYKSLGDNISVIFSNNPRYILHYTRNVLNCDIHSRLRTSKKLRESGAEKTSRLDEIMTASIDGSGWNEKYGLLGSSKVTEDRVKLFPRDCEGFVEQLRTALCEMTGRQVEVMIYGDGGFKDPVGGIWELADPVISPAYTEGIEGLSREHKIKFMAGKEPENLRGDELCRAVKDSISGKGTCCDEGTLPRRHSDILGSLCGLTGGSGDRGTPIILIQNYFKNYASE